ncbi:hypothetical protein J6590_085870 [Homalodisca vitripennis]|nr:hypothetical protein J6590_085870 [Homalodisca vitripennis]
MAGNATASFLSTPKRIATTALSTSRTYTDTVEEMYTGVEGDSESVTNDISERSTKRKQRSSPEVIDKEKEGQRNCDFPLLQPLA